jgi:DNA-binding transcriptional ArsR family regulator
VTPSAKPPLAAQWNAWGTSFVIDACEYPVHLEALLVDTAREYDRQARLFENGIAWLAEYHALVDVPELVRQAAGLRGRDSARLAILLETAQEYIGAPAFAPVLAVCRPWEEPEPLYDFFRDHPEMARLAKKEASPISRKWGLWAPPLDRLKRNALRPPSWIAKHNPAFMFRVLLKGDVRSKVMTALGEERLSEVSETELTRRAGCTRRAMHLALANLERAGLIVRKREGRRYAIRAAQVPRSGLPGRQKAL